MQERIKDVSHMVLAVNEPDVTWQHEGELVVVQKRKFGPIRSRLLSLFGVSPLLTIRMDRLSSQAWLLIDGKRTIGEIKRRLQEKLPDEKELGARLGKFVGILVSNRFVTMQ